MYPPLTSVLNILCRHISAAKVLLDSGSRHLVIYIPSARYASRLTIPVSADAILNSRLGIPLRGAAIGNGWIDPRRQYPTYIDFAVKVGLLEENSEVRRITSAS